jgi:glycosyltransferase involved in cell wall biosynthesis
MTLEKVLFHLADLVKPVLSRILPQALYFRIKSRILLRVSLKKTISVGTSLPDGINLFGYARAEMGLGQGCRLLALAIETTSRSFCVIDFEEGNDSRFNDLSLMHRIVERPIFNTNIIHINPDQHRLLAIHLPSRFWKARYNIGYWLWELPMLPAEWVEGFNVLNEIWSASNYVVENIRKRSSLPVVKIPYGLRILNYDEIGRGHFGLPSDTFLFLTMYDVNSVIERKNPMGAIEAFKRAFTSNDADVGLVIKINNSTKALREVATLKESVKAYRNVFFIENVLTRHEVDNLLFCADTLISLHRAEGFGLVLAESMYLGKPVVATNWSGNVDFMNEMNSCLVNCKLVELDRDCGLYGARGQLWAEPDIDHAASLMRRLYSDSSYYSDIARKGSLTIRKDYTPEKTGEMIVARLKEIGLLS